MSPAPTPKAKASEPEVSKEDEFCGIARDMLVDFLSSEYLRVDSEYQVFVAAMNWVEAEKSA